MGSPALSSSFSVGTASRLLVLGEMLAPWNDRGAPGASSSSVKPPHPFPPTHTLTPSLQPLLQTRLQACPGQAPGCTGALVGVSLTGCCGSPTPSKASVSLPALCPLSLPQLSPLYGGFHCPQPLPDGLKPPVTPDHNALPSPEYNHQHPLLPSSE